MNALVLQISFIMVGGAAMLALMGLVITAIMPGIDRWSKSFFTIYFIILALYIIFAFIEEISYMHPEMRSALMISMYFDSLLLAAPMPLITIYLLHSSGENWPKSPLFRTVAALWLAFFAMLNTTPFATWFYYVTPENQFCRGPLYPLGVIFLSAIVLINLASTIRMRKHLPRGYFVAFLVGLLPLSIAIFLHFFFSVFVLISASIIIGAFSMFIIILSEQIGQYLRQQREIIKQHASIMVLQMRPHFIYNTMMSIYYLCKQNPDLAQQVTLDFTTYLRKNFTAIARGDLIPFPEELEHTRAYLAVEQAQFEDSLFVDYDTPHTRFCLPPLTLQPIVENAVKHGMDQDSEPLHIFIRTRDTGSGSEIIVENNGSEYTAADDNEPHIALKNIRERLEMMCEGTITIMPRDGGGTVVKLTIP